jgi:hypothetical protein
MNILSDAIAREFIDSFGLDSRNKKENQGKGNVKKSKGKLRKYYKVFVADRGILYQERKTVFDWIVLRRQGSC